MESLARAVLVALGSFLALGVVGLLTALRSVRHGRWLAWTALALSATQLVAGLSLLGGLRTPLLVLLLCPGAAGAVVALRRLRR